MKISIVIPTHNERDNIKQLIKRILALNISGLEIIVIDDASFDGTIDIIRALKKRFPITLILRPKKLGLGSALRDGLTLAKTHGATLIITMDGDLSHDPQAIPAMIQSMESGVDLLVGSRRIKGGKIIGWGSGRLIMSRAAMEIARRILKIKTKDVTSGFRVYQRKVLEKINLQQLKSTGYAFQEEVLFRAEQAGFKIIEVPIQFIDRRSGKSKLGIRDILEFFIAVIRLRFYAS